MPCYGANGYTKGTRGSADQRRQSGLKSGNVFDKKLYM